MLKNTIIYVSVIFFLFVGLSRVLGIGETGVERAFSFLVYPLIKGQHAVNAYFSPQTNSQVLMHDLERALEQQEALQQEVIRLKHYLNYKEESQEVRDFIKRYDESGCTIARILLKNFKGSQFFLLDAGTQQGIEKDMVVIYKDCLVGRIIEVYPSYNKALLITDKTCKVAAFCADTNAQGVHEGMNNQVVTMLNYVSHLDQIKIDDLVLSSGEGLVFPRGFALGKVKHYEADPIHHTVTLTPLIDFSKLTYCCIVKNSVILKAEQEQIPESIP